jgi:hypothetical protein
MTSVSADIAVVTELLDVSSGEILPATVENAATVLRAAREVKQQVDGVIRTTTEYLASESAHHGTKTFDLSAGKLTLTGGASVDYDAVDLMEALRVAGCPDERINEAVVAEVSYKVNRSVLRQLAAANPDYKAAIELAERHVDKPWRASVR